MSARKKALISLGEFIEDAEYGDMSRVPEDEYQTARYIYQIIYTDDRKAWGWFLEDSFDDWEDLKDYLPQQVADDIVTWGIY